ncbi:MAG: helix-hairpin-helix domain-containing protein [Rikenellaceae bacterium]
MKRVSSRTTMRKNIGNILTLLLIAVIIMMIFIIERQSRIISDRAAIESIAAATESIESDEKRVQLAPFDPNTASLQELRKLGLTRLQALSVIRYREFVKPFRIKEELINCYEMSDSLYYALEPYITIGEEYRYKREVDTTSQRNASRATATTSKRLTTHNVLAPTKFLVDTVTSRYLTAIGAVTPRQADVFIRWRDMSGIHTEEELRECYTISDSTATWLMNYIIFTPRSATSNIEQAREVRAVDLNRADSATLRSVVGIGEKSVVAILSYRKELGGFHSTEQISELNCITEGNYLKIITQIFADSCDISKIDVNFASAKTISSHPYLKSRARKLLKKRELKGGWSRLEEMIDDDIFTKEEAQRVRPYLRFESQGVE